MRLVSLDIHVPLQDVLLEVAAQLGAVRAVRALLLGLLAALEAPVLAQRGPVAVRLSTVRAYERLGQVSAERHGRHVGALSLSHIPVPDSEVWNKQSFISKNRSEAAGLEKIPRAWLLIDSIKHKIEKKYVLDGAVYWWRGFKGCF